MCKYGSSPSAQIFSDLPQIGCILAILHTLVLPPTPDHCQKLNYIILTCETQRCCTSIVNPPRSNDLPGIAICRWCACATRMGHTFFFRSDSYNSFQIGSDTQMYLCSSALIFFTDWDFSLGHMSMDLSNLLAVLSSHGVPSVTGTKIEVASPQGCSLGLASPDPSGNFIEPGQHLHSSRGYLNDVPAGPIPSLAPQGVPVNTVGPQEVTMSTPPCAAQQKHSGDSHAWARSVAGDQELPAAEAIITKIPVDINRRIAGRNQLMPLAELFRSLQPPPPSTFHLWRISRSTGWTSRSVDQVRSRPQHPLNNGLLWNTYYRRETPTNLKQAVG